MGKKEKAPCLRFKDTNGKDYPAWEQRKLKDFTLSYSGGTPTVSNKNYYNGTIPFIRSGEISGERTELFISEEGLNKSSAKRVHKGQILYALYGATSGEVSLSKIDGAINQAILAISTKEGYSNAFLSFWLRKEKDRITATFLQGGQGNLSGEIVKNLIVPVPSQLEQTKIGNFFNQLDGIITLHQRKSETLKKLKRTLLQKMFPKKGQLKPELRFPGFTNDWEQRKLKDIAEIVGGGTPSTSVPTYWNGSIDWYSPTEVGKDNFARGSKRKISKEGLKNSSAKLLPPHKTILFTSRATIGEAAILEREGATNQGFQSIVTKEGTDVYFLYSYKNHLKKQALIKASGSTFLEISKKAIEELQVQLPSFEEQTKIGSFFRFIDQAITLHQRKLETYKKLKKSLLQKMFI